MESNISINIDRMWSTLMDMAKIGPGIAGGNNRQTLTHEDGEARQLFQKWCNNANLEMNVDELGSMFFLRKGIDNELKPVVIGSHLDTQPTGGKYDGVLGVLAGLEIIRTLNDLDIKTKRPIMIVNWTNEEGCRFAPALMASSGFVGTVDVNKILNTKDLDGKVFKEELAKIGWNGKEKVGSQKMHCYFELHIEQGPILEKENIDIGVVTHGQGLRWLEVELIGVEQHTGTTPMNVRKDAGLVMAKIMTEVNNLANNNQPNLVASVGHIEVYPNSRNVIPGKTIFTIDFRSHIDEKLKDIEAKIRSIVSKISEDHKVKFTIKDVANYDPITFDKNCVNFIRNAAKKYNYTYKDIVSGAGHDACAINTKIPAAMIMCPCVDGISHNEAEEIKKEWALTSTNVLMHAALEAAQ